jgi:hypothetical protein
MALTQKANDTGRGSRHDHPAPPPPCGHKELRFCVPCDAVECKGCGKEWLPSEALRKWLAAEPA